MEFGEIKDVERAKKPQRLPVVFTKEEVKVIIDRLNGYKWIMAQVMYGSGLRVMECVRLRVKDVDFGVLNKGGRGVQSPGDMLWN